MKEKDVCPHCGSHFYDGSHCYSCSRDKPIEVTSIKNTVTLQCQRCGCDYKVYVFYGNGNLDHKDGAERKYCSNCQPKVAAISSAEYRIEHNLLGRTTPKRLWQWHNYLEWIGEREVQQNQ